MKRVRNCVGNRVENRVEKLAGCLLGTAVGDALGLPREGMSRRRALRLFGGAPLRHRFVFGRGLLSDDTEHACMTSQSLLASADDPRAFARSLAWRLRFWLLALPAAVGFGTLRSILKLWIGFPPERSGVRSAGNGPAMRSPVIGACLRDRPDLMRRCVRASTRLTHTDPRAEEGALAVALAAASAVRETPEELDGGRFLSDLGEAVKGEELLAALDLVSKHLARGSAAAELAQEMGLASGVTGYVNHTVPVCLFSWLRHRDDFRAAVEEVVLLGGDTDTTGAITGALAGAEAGESGIPGEWLAGLVDWPRSVAWMGRLAERLARRFPGAPGEEAGPLPLFWPAVIPRNLVFLLATLAHGFRRMLPPY